MKYCHSLSLTSSLLLFPPLLLSLVLERRRYRYRCNTLSLVLLRLIVEIVLLVPKTDFTKLRV
jgi:hypothetical protein